MKKLFNRAILIISIFVLLAPQTVYANMGAPKRSDIGSSVSFEKNDEISVLSEVLDITVKGAKAEIVARYTMQNTTDKEVVTPSMFLSPNIQNSEVSVTINGKAVDYTSKSYSLNYVTEITAVNWQYMVLTDDNIASKDETQTVDSITFDMSFAPKQECEVVVSYIYLLGGYPEGYDFDVKRGEIEYFLAPAASWKGFENLTINLYLDKDMPVIKNSNLEFKKIASRSYQYTSDTLPQENLKITIDENWAQNIISSIKNPYLLMGIKMLLLPILIVVAIIAFIVLSVRKSKKSSKR